MSAAAVSLSMHINKCDTLCVFDDFSKEAVEERIHKLNPKAEVIFVSAKTGEGFDGLEKK